MAVAATPAPRRLSLLDQFFISIHWFGLNFHWGALLAIVIPAEVLRFVPDAEKGRALSSVFAGGALVALLTMPLAGALSDRSLSRFGRRRPFILVGAFLNALALLLLSRAPTLALFALAYWFVQFANNFGGTAYSALIPDLVPEEQRGSASGFMGLMGQLGTVGGAAIAGKLMQAGMVIRTYLSIIWVQLATMVLTLWQVKEAPLATRPPFNLRAFLSQFWVDPRRHPDFAWLFLARFLTNMGFYTLLNFLQYFLKDYLRLPNFTEATGFVTIAVVVGATASTFAAGWISDRIGRRVIVSSSTALMGVLYLIFLTAPSWTFMLALGVLYGVGYGAYLSVDWALAVDVLPSKAAAAKDLGIWGISVTLPQVVAPLVGGPLLDAFNRVGPNRGYTALMIAGAVYLVAGSLTIWKIRGAR